MHFLLWPCAGLDQAGRDQRLGPFERCQSLPATLRLRSRPDSPRSAPLKREPPASRGKLCSPKQPKEGTHSPRVSFLGERDAKATGLFLGSPRGRSLNWPLSPHSGGGQAHRKVKTTSWVRETAVLQRLGLGTGRCDVKSKGHPGGWAHPPEPRRIL